MLVWILACLIPLVQGGKYSVTGPTLTLTLKDPLMRGKENNAPHSPSMLSATDTKPWIDLESIQPEVRWSIQSESAPLPKLVPALRAIKASVVYSYAQMRKVPAVIEGAAKFSRPEGDLLVQPTYETRSGRLDMLVQVSRGTNFVIARLTNARTVLDAVQASIAFNLPFRTISSLRLTPALDRATRDASCIIEAVTGGIGRTKALLHLEYNNPTLSVVHKLDDRNTLSPEISLYNGRITYQWDLSLPDGGALSTRVDPLADIKLTWTDPSRAGGSWITDLRLPLEGTTVQALAADIRVRRKFDF